MASFKAGMFTVGQSTSSFNGLRFETPEKAEEYARDLESRWTAVTGWEIVPSEDEPNRF